MCSVGGRQKVGYGDGCLETRSLTVVGRNVGEWEGYVAGVQEAGVLAVAD